MIFSFFFPFFLRENLLYFYVGPSDVIEVPNIAKEKEQENDTEENA